MGFHPFRHPFGRHSLLHGAAKLASKAAPLAGLIPGVGPLAAAGLGAGAKFVQGATEGHIDPLSVLGTGLTAGASGLANKTLLGGRGILGIGRLFHGGSGGAPAPGEINEAGATGGGGGPGFLGGVGSSVLDYIKRNPLQAAQIGLTGLNVLNSAKQQGRANDLLSSSMAGVRANINPNITPLPELPPNPYSPGGAGRPRPAVRAAQLSLAGG